MIDYNTLLGLIPAESKEAEQIRRTIRILTPRIEAAQKKETGEVFDKLKDVGNSILGICPILQRRKYVIFELKKYYQVNSDYQQIILNLYQMDKEDTL